MRFEKSPFLFIPIHTSPPPLPPQPLIVFESRLGAHDVGNNCTMTMDSTINFHIPQKRVTKKRNALASHKYAAV